MKMVVFGREGVVKALLARVLRKAPDVYPSILLEPAEGAVNSGEIQAGGLLPGGFK